MTDKRHFHNKKPKIDSYKPPFPDGVLAEPVNSLTLREDTLNLLLGAHVNTVGDVLKRTEADFYKIMKFNKKNLLDVKAAVKKRNLFLKPLPIKEPDAQSEQTNAKQDRPKENKPTQHGGQNTDKPAQQNAQNATQNTNKQAGGQNAGKNSRQNAAKQIGEINKQQKHTQTPQNKQAEEQKIKTQNSHPSPEKGTNKQQPQSDKKKNKEKESPYVMQTLPEKPPRPTKVVIKDEPDKYVKINKNGLWGFRDRNSKDMAVPAVYDEVFNFKEELCCVQKGEKFGFINRQGEEVIPVIYDCATSFSEGVACVFKGENCGYINTNGDTVIDFKFDAGTQMTDGECRVKKNGKWGELHLNKPDEIRWII